MSKLQFLYVSALCVLLSGCARDFPLRAYSEDDQVFREALSTESDLLSRMSLARMYFEHNELDKANELLQVLVEKHHDDAEALAWYGANNCKLAGRAQPWLMGLRKLYLVHACLEQVQDAAARAPDDLTVQLVLINTSAAVDMFGALDTAGEALDRLLTGGKEEGDRYAPGPRAHVFLAAAQLSKARGDKQKAMDYLERVVTLNADATTVALAREQLTQL